jgi:DNA-binding SARP family transcriptional activator
MVPGLIKELSDEQDNIRALTAWATADASRVHVAMRAVGSLYWFWYSVGQFREARQLIDRALSFDASGVPDGVRGNAFLSSAINGVAQGEYAQAIAHFEVALPMLRAAGDDDGIGTALSKLGAAHLLAGDVDRAIEILDDVIEMRRGARAPDISMIFARFWRGWAAYQQGDEELARDLVTHNLAVGREFRLPTTIGHNLSVAAQLELARDNIEAACALVSEGLEIEVASGDSWGIAIALDVIAIVAARRGRADDAARLLGAVDAHRKRIAVSLPGLASREQLTVTLRAALGDRFEGLYGEGCHFTTERTVELALAEAARHTAEYRIEMQPVPVTTPLARAHDEDHPRLKVHALGPLHVYVGDRLIDPGAWGSARPRELLVYLLMHPEGRTKEQVGLAFWPEASSAQLRNSFHVTLHRLRKALGGADWVSLANERYRIDPTLVAEFDAADFERDLANARRAIKRQEEGATARLEQALSRFRGDFLDGEPVGDWHLEHRERLQRQYVDGLMELGARWVAEERPAKAAEAYRRVLARDELHEDATVALMRCQSAAGERAQAIRVYRRFVDKLREELDAEPGEEAVQLCEQLQQGVSVSAGL